MWQILEGENPSEISNDKERNAKWHKAAETGMKAGHVASPGSIDAVPEHHNLWEILEAENPWEISYNTKRDGKWRKATEKVMQPATSASPTKAGRGRSRSTCASKGTVSTGDGGVCVSVWSLALGSRLLINVGAHTITSFIYNQGKTTVGCRLAACLSKYPWLLHDQRRRSVARGTNPRPKRDNKDVERAA